MHIARVCMRVTWVYIYNVCVVCIGYVHVHVQCRTYKDVLHVCIKLYTMYIHNVHAHDMYM